MRTKYLLRIIGFVVCNEVVVEGPEVDLVEKIKRARSKDKEVIRVVEEMKKAGVKELRGNE